MNRTARWLAGALTAIWGYLATVLLLGVEVAGVRINGSLLLLLVVVGGAAIVVLTPRLPEARQGNLLASCVSLILSFLLVDTISTVWITRQTRGRSLAAISSAGTLTEERLEDPHVWHGELLPRSYYPSERAFTLYKPNVRVEGRLYGEFYEHRMLESPTLVRDALRIRPLTYTIDANGLRNRIPIGQSKLWALGDSYAMGYSTTEGLTWTDRLGELTGQPVYNLGVAGTGPGVQVQQLEYLLRKGTDRARPDRLLWMVFEGNDLENSYAERRVLPKAVKGVRESFDDTFIGDLLSLPTTIRRRSVIGRLLDGQFRLRALRATPGEDPYRIDGVPLATPVYHSERWGYCMFNALHIDVATKGEDYVLSHPNRPPLDRSFERMKSLAEEFGFRVTVMVAPSAPRVEARDFPAMPQPTAVPYFIQYVEGLSKRNGFQWIDLLGALSADQSGEMLYYCDDHHWNVHGNDVVARFLADQL